MSGETSALKITKWGKSEDAACLLGVAGGMVRKGLSYKRIFKQKVE